MEKIPFQSMVSVCDIGKRIVKVTSG